MFKGVSQEVPGTLAFARYFDYEFQSFICKIFIDRLASTSLLVNLWLGNSEGIALVVAVPSNNITPSGPAFPIQELFLVPWHPSFSQSWVSTFVECFSPKDLGIDVSIPSYLFLFWCLLCILFPFVNYFCRLCLLLCFPQKALESCKDRIERERFLRLLQISSYLEILEQSQSTSYRISVIIQGCGLLESELNVLKKNQTLLCCPV